MLEKITEFVTTVAAYYVFVAMAYNLVLLYLEVEGKRYVDHDKVTLSVILLYIGWVMLLEGAFLKAIFATLIFELCGLLLMKLVGFLIDKIFGGSSY